MKIKSDWHNKPATEKQLAQLDRLGIPYDDGITRGEASEVIAEGLEMLPHPFSEEAFNE